MDRELWEEREWLKGEITRLKSEVDRLQPQASMWKTYAESCMKKLEAACLELEQGEYNNLVSSDHPLQPFEEWRISHPSEYRR